jgi:hypothetical protein
MSESTAAAPAPDNSDADATKSADTGETQSLENVVISLQKTFSRVSASSSKLPPENARSLILGNVNFEMAVPLDASQDRLFYSPTGKVSLKLTGTIQQDVRPIPRQAADPKSKPSAGDDLF